MNNSIILGFSFLFLVACNTNELPKIKHTDRDSDKTLSISKDTTLVEIADLPIHMDSTSYLIHPIGSFKMYGSESKIYSGSSGNRSGNFYVSNYNNYSITGNLHNLKFQHLGSEHFTVLTKKNIRISAITFLRDLFDNNKKQLLIYRVLDMDTNQDNKLDTNDVETLYMSNIDGSDFKKLAPEFQELIDWKFLSINNRLYFRSIEDINKDGEFDKDDKIHYYYVDFNDDTHSVMTYNPI